MKKLAINGGVPIRTKRWNNFPLSDNETEKNLIDVLNSGRWTISGFGNNSETFESKFSQSFSQFNDVKYCIPTANGTSALKCALIALGVKEGDEVIIPGLTWVACAVAVVELNAIPIIVDIDTKTLCISPSEILKAISPRTKVLMVVHLYGAIADMDSITKIAKLHKLKVLEDCAQAHGAIWRGKKVGTIGDIGTFSMQQGKILTAGEGGACITNNLAYSQEIYKLRTNGRYKSSQLKDNGYMELIEEGGVFSSNYCLSEFQCAILLARLSKLDSDNTCRYENYLLLKKLLIDVKGLNFQESSLGTDFISIYHLAIRINDEILNILDIDYLCKALSAELNFNVHKPYPPLNMHPLYQPEFSNSSQSKELLNPKHFSLFNAEKAHRSTIVLHHSLLLGSKEDIHDIADAFKKVLLG